MSVDLERLERLAKAAKPFPWIIYRRESFVCITTGGHMAEPMSYKDAEYISALIDAAPDLIAENRALQKRVRELEEHKKLLAGYAESAHTCSQCPAKHFNLCPPNEEDRARFSRPCINALIQWAERVTKEDAERTYRLPWEANK